MLDLDKTGWPQLPTVGSRIRFVGGSVILSIIGECVIVRAEHARNAAGRPGGNVTVRTDRGEHVKVGLSVVREHAELVQDGVEGIELD